MASIELVDVSLRDGNQSLWGATGLRTAHVAQIAPVLNRVGFRALDFSSSTAMGVSVRTHRENPWDLLRLTRKAMPDTRLQFIGTGFRFISWERAHPEVMELVYTSLVNAGMDRFVVLDPTHDMDAVRETARIIKRAGGQKFDYDHSLYPNVSDGVDGMNFLDKCVASSKDNGHWLPLKHPACRS